MDWKVGLGLGISILSLVLPSLMKSMPNWISWPCVSIGVLFMAWGFLSSMMNISTGPALLFISCFAGLVGSVAWQYNIKPMNLALSDKNPGSQHQDLQPSIPKQPTAKEIARDVLQQLPDDSISKKIEEPKEYINHKPPTLTALIPHLQVTPLDIEERPDSTVIKFNVLNDSDYLAKNILLDIKFGDSLWEKEAWKASSIDFHNKLLNEKDDPLMAEILSDTSEQKLKEMLKNYIAHPTISELRPGAKVKLYIMDENKDFLVKHKMYFASGGKMTPIDPQESTSYLVSQGWKEQIDKNESGKPIEILLAVSWENEKGKLFAKTIKYHLICTKIKTGRSYKFLPARESKTNYN